MIRSNRGIMSGGGQAGAAAAIASAALAAAAGALAKAAGAFVNLLGIQAAAPRRRRSRREPGTGGRSVKRAPAIIAAGPFFSVHAPAG
jgi:hypothetical protein